MRARERPVGFLRVSARRIDYLIGRIDLDRDRVVEDLFVVRFRL